jgi:hypothetical protein
MSLFKSASSVETPVVKNKKSSKKEIHIDGLKTVAELDALIKSLTTLKASIEVSVKEDAMKHFIEIAKESKSRPDNFTGVDENATASIELRKRSTASALTKEDMMILEDNDIPFEIKIITQKLFAINPVYHNDEKLLEKVSKAIQKFVPEDFIVIQEEKSMPVISDETIENAFVNSNIEEVISIVSTLAIKPKLSSVNVSEILKSVSKLIEEK